MLMGFTILDKNITLVHFCLAVTNLGDNVQAFNRNVAVVFTA